ncbi:uncharacterized protein [Heptranchias perlo]|uniref:uncharacterized protein n=1 Tax=Heptranchias perlo TaxID=212740 RepID=UPI00355A5594
MPASDLFIFSLEDELKSKAKLPRGIKNIRPHLEHVENIPLLLLLFTYCTSESGHKRSHGTISKKSRGVLVNIYHSTNIHKNRLWDLAVRKLAATFPTVTTLPKKYFIVCDVLRDVLRS